jgi:phospholipid-transporting ATPase
VKYIFSDKTGTLTRNVMDFKKCTVAEHIYTLEETPYETQLVKVNVDFVMLKFDVSAVLEIKSMAFWVVTLCYVYALNECLK